MKNLIYIEKNAVAEFECLTDLYNYIFGKKYSSLSDREKFIRRYEVAFYKLKFNRLDYDIVHTKIGTLGDKYSVKEKTINLSRAIIIDNEKEMLMSLCKLPNITIMESKYCDGFLSKKQKDKYKGNYVLIDKII